MTTTTRYLYDNEDIIAEYDVNGNLITKYIHGLGIDEPLAMEKNSSTYYYHADGLGSVVALTDSAGNVVQKYEYDSFRNITSIQNPSFIQPYMFTGREYDPENGTYHYRARTLDQKTGTFISKDPIGFSAGDVNLYRYVFNSPVNYVDPLGLLSVEEAVSHYFFGKGKPVTVPFSDVDIGLQPKDFPGYTALVNSMSKQKGTRSFDFNLVKDIGGWAGNTKYRFKGAIISNKCEWKSVGLIGAYDNPFDFHSLPWGDRDYWKEVVTRMIGYLPVGQSYDINIRGYRLTTEGGKW